MKITLLK